MKVFMAILNSFLLFVMLVVLGMVMAIDEKITEKPAQVELFFISTEYLETALDSQRYMLHYSINGVPHTAFFSDIRKLGEFREHLQTLYRTNICE